MTGDNRFKALCHRADFRVWLTTSVTLRMPKWNQNQ